MCTGKVEFWCPPTGITTFGDCCRLFIGGGGGSVVEWGLGVAWEVLERGRRSSWAWEGEGGCCDNLLSWRVRLLLCHISCQCLTNSKMCLHISILVSPHTWPTTRSLPHSWGFMLTGMVNGRGWQIFAVGIRCGNLSLWKHYNWDIAVTLTSCALVTCPCIITALANCCKAATCAALHLVLWLK